MSIPGTDQWRESVGAEIDKAISQVTGFEETTVGMVTNNIMANVSVFRLFEWYYLLLRLTAAGYTEIEGIDVSLDDGIIPACPDDAEKLDRIRKVVEGA